jgi:MFS family permease
MSQDRAALKLSLMGLAAASVEWYDFLLYGTAAALVFPTVFFPATMPTFIAQIASFSTFAVGFIARPFGGVLFGHLGDKLGRKKALVAALLLMGLATTSIGFLPSYETAGAAAPLALIVLRMAQGLAVGGQWGGATLLATESAPSERRGLYGGIAQVGVFAGVLLANVAVLAVNGMTTSEDFMAYGWRIPFLFSLVLVGLGLWVHYRVDETRAFKRLREHTASPDAAAAAPFGRRSQPPLLAAVRAYPGRILLAAGILLPLHAIFYVIVTYAVAYGTSRSGLHLPRSTMLGAVLIAQLVAAPVAVLAGALSDHFGRRRIVMTGIALVGIWALALFPLIDTRSFTWISVALAIAASANAVAYGPLGTMFAELFDTRMRYSAMSLAYQLGAIAGGGFVPIIATTLFARFHTNTWTALYIMLASAVALICTIKLQETAVAKQSSLMPASVVDS